MSVTHPIGIIMFLRGLETVNLTMFSWKILRRGIIPNLVLPFIDHNYPWILPYVFLCR